MTDQLCATREASCICILAADHKGAHVCTCGGSWYFDDAGEFCPVSWPVWAPPDVELPHSADDAV